MISITHLQHNSFLSNTESGVLATHRLSNSLVVQCLVVQRALQKGCSTVRINTIGQVRWSDNKRAIAY